MLPSGNSFEHVKDIYITKNQLNSTIIKVGNLLQLEGLIYVHKVIWIPIQCVICRLALGCLSTWFVNIQGILTEKNIGFNNKN